MEQQAITQKFTAALDALVEQVKEDRTVLAALLCGSMAPGAAHLGFTLDVIGTAAWESRPSTIRESPLLRSLSRDQPDTGP